MLRNLPTDMDGIDYLRQFPKVLLILGSEHLDENRTPKLGPSLDEAYFRVEWFDFREGMRLGGGAAILSRLHPWNLTSVIFGEAIWLSLCDFLEPLLLPNPVLIGASSEPPHASPWYPIVFIEDNPELESDLVRVLQLLASMPKKYHPQRSHTFDHQSGAFFHASTQTTPYVEDVWKYVEVQLSSNIQVPVWSRAKGHLGREFTISEIDRQAEAITVDSPTARNLQRIPAADFRLVWDHWETYISGSLQRKELTAGTRYSTYVISILKLIDKWNSTNRQPSP